MFIKIIEMNMIKNSYFILDICVLLSGCVFKSKQPIDMESSTEIIELEKDIWILDNVYDYGAVDSTFEFSERGCSYNEAERLTLYIQGDEIVLNDTARVRFNSYKIAQNSFFTIRDIGRDYAYQLDILQKYYSVNTQDSIVYLEAVWNGTDEYLNAPSIIRNLKYGGMVLYDSCYLTLPYKGYLVVFQKENCSSSRKRYDVGKFPAKTQKLPFDFRQWVSQYEDGIQKGEFNIYPIKENSFLSELLVRYNFRPMEGNKRYIPTDYFLISKTDSVETYIINTHLEGIKYHEQGEGIRFSDLITLKNDSIISFLNVADQTIDPMEHRIIYNIAPNLKIHLYEISCKDWLLFTQGFPVDTLNQIEYQIEGNGVIVKID